MNDSLDLDLIVTFVNLFMNDSLDLIVTFVTFLWMTLSEI